MNDIRVECYAGYRSDERPLRFVIHGTRIRGHRSRWTVVFPRCKVFPRARQ